MEKKRFSFRTVHISYVYDFTSLLGEIGEEIGVHLFSLNLARENI